MPKVALIEDLDSVREMQKRYLSSIEDFTVVIDANSVEDFQEKFESYPGKIDLIVSDIGLPGMSGIEGAKWIKSKSPETEIIMVSVFTDTDNIFKALCAGAVGYLEKNTPLPELEGAIRTVMSSGSPMTPSIARKVIQRFNPVKPKDENSLSTKELQVVECVVEGLSYKLIADRLGITINTVRHHIRNIYKKLHINSKAELISKSYNDEIS